MWQVACDDDVVGKCTKKSKGQVKMPKNSSSKKVLFLMSSSDTSNDLSISFSLPDILSFSFIANYNFRFSNKALRSSSSRSLSWSISLCFSLFSYSSSISLFLIR